MFCRNCGKELADTAKFCNGCGEKIVKKEPAPVIEEKDSDKTVFMMNDDALYNEPVKEEPAFNEPVVEQPSPVFASDENVKAPKMRKKPHFVLSFFCVILMILVYGLEMAFGALLTVRLTTSEGAVKKAVESIEIASLEIEVDGEDMTFAEAIVNEITDDSVDEDDVERLIEDFEGEEFFADVVIDLSDYLFNGGDVPEIDVDEVMEVIDDNEKLIEDVTGTSISASDKREIEDVAEDFVRDFNDAVEEIEGAEQVNDITVNFGLNLMTGISVMVLVFILAILVLCYKLSGSGIYRAFRAYAIPTGIAGALFVLISLVAPVIINSVANIEEELISTLVSGIVVFPMYAGIILLVACVTLIVGAVVSYVVYNKNRK